MKYIKPVSTLEAFDSMDVLTTSTGITPPTGDNETERIPINPKSEEITL